MVTHGYLTPDEIPAELVCRVLFIPNDQLIIAAVNGALLQVAETYNWEQFGAITPAEISAALLPLVLDFMGSRCMPQVDVFLHSETQGTAGGGITANTNTRFPFNVPESQNAGNVSLDANIFTIQPGEYLIDFEHILRGDAAYLSKSWIALEPGTIIAIDGLSYNMPAVVQSLHHATYHHIFASEVDIAFWARSSDTRNVDAFGVPANFTGLAEMYGIAKFVRLGDAS